MAVIPKGSHDVLETFKEQLDGILESLLKSSFGECEFSPQIDVYETPTDYLVEAELPGFEKNDLSLRIFQNIMAIEGVKRQDSLDRNVRFIRMERHFGCFYRTVGLPPYVDTAQVKATFQLGLLKVAFRKLSDKRPTIREIPIE
ncbi:MAG: Hsp20/alpha crystallin family protein [Geobacter sp.]|nr:Hsp20/alpha crystallin family protein [Geobacter sp.]